MRKFIDILRESVDWFRMTEDELRSYAAQWVGFATDEMGEPDDLSWKMEGQFPLRDFRGLAIDWEDYFQDDVRRNSKYDERFETADFHTPIVVSFEDGQLFIWDGYHRIATAIHRGDETIMAIVGFDAASRYLVESAEQTYTLYHGTCSDTLCRTGWEPGSGLMGGNMGQTRYLYLTNAPENAKWFANEKGCDVVLVVKDVPASLLRVDPEDGSADTVEEELSSPHGLPGNVVLTAPLSAEHFAVWQEEVTEDADLGEGPAKEGRVSLITKSGEEPKFLYRVMSPAEYASAKRTGVLRSHDGRVHAAGRPHLQYCQPGENLLVRIAYHFEDGWRAKRTLDDVVAITDTVPFDRLSVIASGTRDEIEAAL